ncbi:hypothetical protein [uncultured Pseudoteredinibacter sp.]|uniref:hypothetical protein n=1 Tax=uncultured Pseudoteredinibacter sp. TaxID=1641701 RepID=UPI00260A1B3F|nr:hypothetical protein [uncultured Pseudoteredinibacter sp.]
MKKKLYKVVGSATGLKGLEEAVMEKMAEGWQPIGGLAFNQGYPYQAMGKVVDPEARYKPAPSDKKEQEIKPKSLSANEANRKLDNLT